MFQGKFNVLMDPYKNEIVHRYAYTSQKIIDSYPFQQKNVSTQMFEEQILSGLENGWDGKPIRRIQ